MKIFDIYNNVMKSSGDVLWIPPDVSSWPEEWTTIYRKWYERYKTVVLPLTQDSFERSLQESFFKRKTGYDFMGSISLESLSQILYFGAGENHFRFDKDNNKRFYPSAGAKYPIEIYLLLQKDVGLLSAGVYHYDPQDHVLQVLPFQEEDLVLARYTAQSSLHGAAGAILFTAVLSRSSPKYGERSYKYALIETGEILQSMCLVAASQNIVVAPVSLLHDLRIEDILSIDGTNEVYVHSLFLG